MEQFYDILKQLVRIPSVVGAEHPFFMFLKRELEELDLTVEYYDGVLVAKGSEPSSGYISAHADRHGLICTGHNEFRVNYNVCHHSVTHDNSKEVLRFNKEA